MHWVLKDEQVFVRLGRLKGAGIGKRPNYTIF